MLLKEKIGKILSNRTNIGGSLGKIDRFEGFLMTRL